MTAEARFERLDEGRWTLAGVLDFATVPDLLVQVRGLRRSAQAVELDLRGVTRADSAGLALLIEFLRSAERAGGKVRFANVPAQLLSIARLSGLDGILSLPAATPA